MILTQSMHTFIGYALLFMTYQFILQDFMMKEFYPEDSEDIAMLLKKGTIVFIPSMMILFGLFYAFNLM